VPLSCLGALALVATPLAARAAMNSSYHNSHGGHNDDDGDNSNNSSDSSYGSPPVYDVHDRDTGGYSQEHGDDDNVYRVPLKKPHREDPDEHLLHEYAKSGVVMLDCTWYCIGLLVYCLFIGVVALGQQHIGWTVSIGVWVAVITVGQLASVMLSAYYWKKLALVSPVYKRELHVITTTSQVYMLVLSIDAWWMYFYVPDTYAAYMQSMDDVYTANSFAIILVLMVIQLIVFVPRLIIFIVGNSEACKARAANKHRRGEE
jgi:hypothetical protein